eukprot:12294000-Ditylum_brightwellii.AAC.1
MLTLLEDFKYDISYASRKGIINFDNDAAFCYNRIIPNLASLITRKKVLGISEAFYQHCQVSPIYGMGQGSTNSPSIWLLISSTLLDIYEAEAHGASFTTPDKETSVSLSMVGFVDDSQGN